MREHTMSRIPQHSVTFKVHKKSVQIGIRTGKVVPSREAGSRGRINGFSYKSERNLRLLLEDTSDRWETFLTLTYPEAFPTDGRKVDRDRRAFFKRLRRRYGRRDYISVLEFQRRGAPHVHILTDGPVDREWLSQAWYEVVGSGDTRHLAAGTRIDPVKDKERVATYMLGYLKKRIQKDVPEGYENVGRFWTSNLKVPEQITGEHVRRFRTEAELLAYIEPLVTRYKQTMAEWSQGREKPYEWKFRGIGFTMWSGADAVNAFLQGEQG